MEPYTEEDRMRDWKIRETQRKKLAEETCKYCGVSNWGFEYYPFICALDTKGRDCEGKCKSYKSIKGYER